MNILSLVLLFALAFLVVWMLSKPLFDARNPDGDQALQRQASLQAERERLLSALQELDFDHGVGKMSTVDYTAQRAALMAEAVNVERRIELASDSRQK